MGGPIALVQEGDRIRVDIPNTRLELLVSDEELEKRRAQWQPKEPKVTTGYLARYAAMVTRRKQEALLLGNNQNNKRKGRFCLCR